MRAPHNNQQLAAGGDAAAEELLALSHLINQAVGDAISGVLLVEASLRRRVVPDLGVWAALYDDLPSRQAKVVVPDRSAIRTSRAETRVEAPQGLQALIDEAVAAVPQGAGW